MSRADKHQDLVHVVKCSGERSSAAVVYLLADADRLQPERGEVILFANTSAEQPATYQPVAKVLIPRTIVLSAI